MEGGEIVNPAVSVNVGDFLTALISFLIVALLCL